MVFKVSVGHGPMRLSIDLLTAAQALGEARNQAEHHAVDVRIQIVSTGEEFTFDEFRSKIASATWEAPLE